jgi:hypothetical protein
VSTRLGPVTTILAACFLLGSTSALPQPGDPWKTLRRTLHLPRLAPGDPCPRSRSARRGPGVAGALGPAALGRGPAYATVGSRNGIASLGPHSDTARVDGWYFRKTFWHVDRRYQGPLLIRGRRIDGFGPRSLRFQPYGPPAFARSKAELRWPAGWPVENRTRTGWRQLPGSTVLRGPGCYAFQVDGRGFSEVIVFEAVLPRRSR